MTTTITLAASDGSISTLTIPTPTVVATGKPVLVRSYGPNGTHYPTRTPWLYGVIPHVMEVDCTWAAIKAARNAFTAAQVTAGAHIKVRPGVLPGSGGSAGSTSMMTDAGRVTDTMRVLVTPRDGSASVSFSGDVRLNRVHQTALLGFDFYPRGLTTTGCTGFALAWTTIRSRRTLGIAGMITENVDNVEVVQRVSQLGDLDPAGYGSGYVTDPVIVAQGSGMLRNCLDDGCYIAPQYLLPAGTGHNDSCQLYGGGGIYTGFTFRDFVSFGSNNCALQIGGFPSDPRAAELVGATPFLTLDNALLINAGTGSKPGGRYPLPPEAKQGVTGAAINGAGRSGYLNAKDVIAIGSIYTTNWDTVDNSVATVAPRPARVGAWRQDTTLASQVDKAWVDARVPMPTDAYLASIWGPIRNTVSDQ